MESSKLKDKLYDPIRQIWVASTPEEIIRQQLLHMMITQLGYPKALVAVEVQLSEMPHLKSLSELPKRRADILCYANGIHRDYLLYPLLLIECKEGQVGKEAIRQVIGYNHFVDAPFVAVAGEGDTRLIFPQEAPFLPSYEQLMERVCL